MRSKASLPTTLFVALIVALFLCDLMVEPITMFLGISLLKASLLVPLLSTSFLVTMFVAITSKVATLATATAQCHPCMLSKESASIEWSTLALRWHTGTPGTCSLAFVFQIRVRTRELTRELPPTLQLYYLLVGSRSSKLPHIIYIADAHRGRARRFVEEDSPGFKVPTFKATVKHSCAPR